MPSRPSSYCASRTRTPLPHLSCRSYSAARTVEWRSHGAARPRCSELPLLGLPDGHTDNQQCLCLQLASISQEKDTGAQPVESAALEIRPSLWLGINLQILLNSQVLGEKGGIHLFPPSLFFLPLNLGIEVKSSMLATKLALQPLFPAHQQPINTDPNIVFFCSHSGFHMH